jgi:hypothetical protein
MLVLRFLTCHMEEKISKLGHFVGDVAIHIFNFYIKRTAP